MKKLYVVTCISNPVRFKSRYRLYKRFARHMKRLGAHLITVEAAYGQRPFVVTEKDNPDHVQVRGSHELWLKENLLNIGIAHLCQMYPDAEYISWCDSDIRFMRNDILEETVHQLQHYKVVQMFQQCVDLGPSGEAIGFHQGFAWSYVDGRPRPMPGKYAHWHPGYAWAIRRSALDDIGRLMDFSILGSGDHLMAWSFIGEGFKQLPRTMSSGYKEAVMLWEERAKRYIGRSLGFVPGLIHHEFHGSKRNRHYQSRWKILSDYQYDPEYDIKYDSQGLLQLNLDGSDRMYDFRDAIMRYNRSRFEDATHNE